MSIHKSKSSSNKTIAIVAHDSRKHDMIEWVNFNKEKLSKYNLVGTSGTCNLIKNIVGIDIESLGHGPDGGDIHIAKAVLDGDIDKIFFLIDVRTPQGHETDIQALIRTCVLKNIPIALNRSTADYIISSELMG